MLQNTSKKVCHNFLRDPRELHPCTCSSTNVGRLAAYNLMFLRWDLFFPCLHIISHFGEKITGLPLTAVQMLHLIIWSKLSQEKPFCSRDILLTTPLETSKLNRNFFLSSLVEEVNPEALLFALFISSISNDWHIMKIVPIGVVFGQVYYRGFKR